MDGVNVAVLIGLLPHLPLFVVYLVGLALAASYAASLRTAALMAGIGFAFLIASWLVGSGTQYWLATMPRDQIRASMGLVGLLTWLREGTALAGTIFLLIAIFTRRGESRAA